MFHKYVPGVQELLITHIWANEQLICAEVLRRLQSTGWESGCALNSHYILKHAETDAPVAAMQGRKINHGMLHGYIVGILHGYIVGMLHGYIVEMLHGYIVSRLDLIWYCKEFLWPKL